MAEDEKRDDPESEEKPEGEGEAGQGGEEGLHPPKKKLSKKMLIILGVVGLLVIGGGTFAGLYFTGVIGGHAGEGEKAGEHGEAKGEGGEKAEADAHGGEGEGAEANPEGVAPTFYPLGEIVVNLSGDGKRPNFLKITVNLELADEKDVPAIEALKPRIVDQFQMYLRELRVEDLRGSAGLYRLREELLLRVTETVQPIRVRDVLFQEMLVQ